MPKKYIPKKVYPRYGYHTHPYYGQSPVDYEESKRLGIPYEVWDYRKKRDIEIRDFQNAKNKKIWPKGIHGGQHDIDPSALGQAVGKHMQYLKKNKREPGDWIGGYEEPPTKPKINTQQRIRANRNRALALQKQKLLIPKDVPFFDLTKD